MLLLHTILLAIACRFTNAAGSFSCNKYGEYMSSGYCSGGNCFGTCKDCPSGRWGRFTTYCSPNSCNKPECNQCDDGKFTLSTGHQYATDCKDCPSGTWSIEPSTSTCTKCNRGYGKDQGTCKACKVGRYQNQRGLTQCKNCPNGKTTANDVDDGTGRKLLSDCTGCSIGAIFTGVSPNLVCTTCAAGKYRDTFSTQPTDSCVDCLTGTFITDDQTDPNEHDDANDCKTCPIGYQYLSPAGCEMCAGGKYQNEPSSPSVVCKACPANTFLADDKGEAVAHDQLEDCMDCQSGKFSAPGKRFCEACQAGQVKQGSSCEDCTVGKYSTGNEQECVLCGKGFHQKKEGMTFCLPCVQGKYNNLAEQAECKSCPVGTFSNDTELQQCYQCLDGTFTSSVGRTYCQKCEVGKFGYQCSSKCSVGKYRGAEDDATNGCLQCDRGMYQDQEQQASCFPCVPGKYNNLVERSTCKKCDVGQFSNDTMMRTCLSCEDGKAAESRGSAQCQECSAGTYGAGCKVCQAGKYRSSDDVTHECKPCEAGKYQPEQGQASCLPCIRE